MSAHVLLGIARLGSAVDHRQHARGCAAVQRPGERADGGRHRRCAVGARRGGDARGERRRVQAVLGGRDPVGVERLDGARVGLAAPADQELRGGVLALLDLGLGHRRLLAARGLGDDRQRRGREAREVVARLLVVDVDELLHVPHRAERRERRLQVGRHGAARLLQVDRLGRRQRRVDVLVDEQAPDVLERVAADELLDVDAAIAKGATVLVGFGDLGLERDDAFETGAEITRRGAHRREPYRMRRRRRPSCEGRRDSCV